MVINLIVIKNSFLILLLLLWLNFTMHFRKSLINRHYCRIRFLR